MRPGWTLALSVLLALALPSSPAPTAPGTDPLTYGGPVGRIAVSEWQVREDPGNVGIDAGWGAGGWTGPTVKVPWSPNAHPESLRGPDAERNFAGSRIWYRTTVEVPRAGRWVLDFQSVNHRATVWVDGKQVGPSHEGEFHPFAKHFRAPGPGSHTVVVRADYTGIERQNATGWHRTWFNFGGINREVTLRRVGQADIEAPMIFTRLGPESGDAYVTVRARLRNHGAARTVQLDGTLVHGDTLVDLPFPAVEVPGGARRTVQTRVRIADPLLWTPDDPALHELTLSLGGRSRWRARVGLRQLTWRGREVFLNGRRLHVHGASIHEDARGRGSALTARDMDDLVADLQEVGANVTRAHHPLAPALLERLDAAGILVYQELGPNDPPGGFSLKTPELRRQGRHRVRVSLDQLQRHPSIFAWTLANEAAGRGHNDGQRPWVDSIARMLHRRDPGRLVGVDLWGTYVPDSDAGLLMYRNLDMVGLTNYDGWYNDNHARGERLRAVLRASVDEVARAFPRKVIFLTEFGAEANDLNPPHRAGGYAFQARLLREHLRVYEADPRVAGMMIWILRDFAVTPAFKGGSIRQEVPDIRLMQGIVNKGLFDYRGRAKPAAAEVARLYKAWPTFR